MPKTEHTPGPWGWFGNADGTNIYLSTVNHGRRFVMGFKRWGMARAQPTFQVNGVMQEVKHLLKFEVGNPDVTGVEAAKLDGSVYRMDIAGIDHPDARLIAAAPDLLEACQAFAAWDENAHNTEADAARLRRMVAAAIARATGKEVACA